jgi:hypothetical protein
VDDLDWSCVPVPLESDREAELFAYYANMSYIALEDRIPRAFGVDLPFVRRATTATEPEPVLAVA